MSLTSSLAIYFIIWWLVLFAVLPWGIRSRHETGEHDALADAGSPVQPRLLLKAGITTLVAAVIFALVWVCVEYRLVTLDSFPLLQDYSAR